MSSNIENNEYVVAALSRNKLLKADEQTRLKALALAITEAYKFRGQQPNAEDLVDMAKSLCRKISQQEGIDPTIEEIRIAFEYGVTGEYGEYYGINYVTLWNWVKNYLWSQDRLDALDRYRRTHQKPQTTNLLAEKSESQKEAERIASINSNIESIFEDLKAGEAPVLCYHTQESVYRQLRAAGIMEKPSDEEIAEAWNKGIDILKRRKVQTARRLADIIDDAMDADSPCDDRAKITRYASAVLLQKFLLSLDKPPVLKQ